ncbi:MAG: hypothetical protein U9R75_10850 [Candidatus Thermoplasmatota archaeon]|nr:hypothetical protein [Candidatus Thermoplasmatota archaeon]
MNMHWSFAKMKKRSHTGRVILAVTIMLSLSFTPFLSVDSSSAPAYTRSGNKAVEVVLNHTRIVSGGISQWGPFSLGIVNRTTIVETRIRNNLDAPLSGVIVNLTIYWYNAADGFSFDKGRVIHKDTALVSLPAGSGRLSGLIEFPWVPSYAGSYILNISTHAPGDPRPVTHFLLIGGYQYTTDNHKLTDGRWVGTQFWNASSMDGWTTYTEGAEQSTSWHISDHLLGDNYEDLHTPDGVFWVGNETSGMSPIIGLYNLVSPVIDLTRFDPNPYDVFTKTVRPQIYLLYRYRGNITPNGPLGIGGIFHWIRTSEDGLWGEWEKMKDANKEWINISGNTNMRIWDWAKRPDLNSSLDFVGIDLGNYRGKEVQVRFEYRPSGYLESGYVMDDILVIGKHRVDITPFEVTGLTDDEPQVEPGSLVDHSMSIVSRLTSIDPDIDLRIDCVDSSTFIDKDRDVHIYPQIIALEKDDDRTIRINVSIDIPRDAPFGPGWIKVRLVAGGLVKDVIFRSNILSRRSLEMTLGGEVDGVIGSDNIKQIYLHISNNGNVKESFNVTFVPMDDLVFNGPVGQYDLVSDQQRYINGSINVMEQSIAGSKIGYFILYYGMRADIETLRERIASDDIDTSWKILKVEYDLVQQNSIQLYASSAESTYVSIADPPADGVGVYNYDLIVHNSGNGKDAVSFGISGWEDRGDIVIRYPSDRVLDPGEVRVIRIDVEIKFPIPWGLYNFTITVFSSGMEEENDNSITMTMSVGRATITEGIFLLNGSLNVDPKEIILGRESLVSFLVRSYGLLNQENFVVNLWEDGKVVTTRQLNISRSQDKEYQIPWTFGTPGEHVINVSLSEEIDPSDLSEEISFSLSTSVTVGHIELYIGEISIMSDNREVDPSCILPGNLDIIVEIGNSGDAIADLATIVLEILDPATQLVWNLTLNLTEIAPGFTKELLFKNLKVGSNRLLQISVWIDNGDRWREIRQDDDLKTFDMDVGEEPPKEPVWREPLVGIVTILLTLIAVSILFFYLMRKKL